MVLATPHPQKNPTKEMAKIPMAVYLFLFWVLGREGGVKGTGDTKDATLLCLSSHLSVSTDPRKQLFLSEACPGVTTSSARGAPEAGKAGRGAAEGADRGCFLSSLPACVTPSHEAST